MMIHKLRPYTYNKALAHPQQYSQQWQLPSRKELQWQLILHIIGRTIILQFG